MILGYCIWQRKPIRPILFTSICTNLITQFLLWGLLNFFFSYYLVVLIIAEILIWLIESFVYYVVPANRLQFVEAIFLSLILNLTSFGLGWFLPI